MCLIVGDQKNRCPGKLFKVCKPGKECFTATHLWQLNFLETSFTQNRKITLLLLPLLEIFENFLEIVDIWLAFSGRKCCSHRRLFFSYVILTEIRTNSFNQEFRCSGTRNKFGTGAFPRKCVYAAEHLSWPCHCQYLPVSSLRIKENTIIFPESKHTPKRR